MQREIEFRGKHNYTGEWYFGCLLEGEDTIFIRDKVRHEKHGYLTYPLIPETVGQLWTTKDNTKFYEGDIISFGISGRLICVLIYNEINKCFSFIEKSEYNKLQTADELLRSNILSNLSYAKVEMIKALLGNIHDNPELLNN